MTVYRRQQPFLTMFFFMMKKSICYLKPSTVTFRFVHGNLEFYHMPQRKNPDKNVASSSAVAELAVEDLKRKMNSILLIKVGNERMCIHIKAKCAE